MDNGPFDPRITAIPFIQSTSNYDDGRTGGPKLTRGFIIAEKPINNVRYRCNFLYNPSVLNVAHSVDSNVLADPNSQVPDDVTSGVFLMPLSQSVNFTLLFDRTYELWDSSKLTGDARIQVPLYGVAYDVLSLYKITGIAAPMTLPAQGTAADATALSGLQKGAFSGGPAGPMVNTPAYAVIGSSLSYYGFITELDVQYTHWTQSMVPQRGQVSVTMNLLPTPPSGNPYAFPSFTPHTGSTGNSGKAGR
jgi:hypothetical protein